ncbi:MAE_28990/MAE_18760 family HEPN-like nuclease [Clostridium perfringens]|uniref:MAE_28990/MAE_18760 family HEPN-like nuclease n=1 Tax=Clostridium perfringens TaxID=1502 RepID=UPI001CB5348C|nr:MAE_28990/MAE_18760 family HEPN-like nuclease [Clostridium perfringens]EIF6157012.1 hypothetical protein [Clostridium perfringens]MDB2051930.1 MAE_28990/MAE_18760 family HEPN-like nuclease [Clostridium perfringens]MDK0607933.1 MAE_28990/MAE_18760 family HEPN-like nuclease [Clostridium perfringens]MDK0738809.1 MAE_28990/MAE_18760 family HEPN-like nuclease [Clostridium perfringens]MDM0622118.1 MAE_28990/MAE_18760 family HEPN-like nuclease [Clostridium perfringens]
MNSKIMVEEFVSKIDEQLAIRKKELTQLKEIIDASIEISKKFILIRNTIPAIYANYEGFLQFGFKELIKVIKQFEGNNYSLNKNIMMISILTSLENHINTQKSKSERLLEIFNDFYNNKKVLENANLDKYIINHETLYGTCEILGIDLNNIIKDEERIVFNKESLQILYERRNVIAHGNISEGAVYTIPRKKEITEGQVKSAYLDWNNHYECVMETLDILKDIFIDYLISEKFLEK